MSEMRKGLPRSEESELMVLGAILRWPELGKSCTLDRADFYSERNRTIYQAIAELTADNRVPDPTAVSERLRMTRGLEIAGGESNLMDLVDGVVSRSGWEEWQRIVRNKSTLRQIIDAARQVNEAAFEDSDEADDIVAEWGKKLAEVSRRGTSGIISMQDAYNKAKAEKAVSPFIRTGVDFVDSLIGMRSGQLGIIAGRPGEGKSALATQIASQLAYRDEVLFSCLEMTPEELVDRIIAQQTGFDIGNVIHGRLDPDQVAIADDVAVRISLNFCAARTVPELRADVLSRIHHGRLKLVVVDYLQLMTAPGYKGNKNAEVSEISRGLKLLAMETGVSVIALSQFSRDAARGEPELHHLRDSGSIEQDANWVAFIYDDGKGIGDQNRVFKVAKNRSGPKGAMRLHFGAGRVTFFKADA